MYLKRDWSIVKRLGMEKLKRGCLVNLKLFGTSTISQSFWEYKQEVINVKELMNPGMQPQGHQVLLLCKYARRDQSNNIKISNMHDRHCQLKTNNKIYLSESSVILKNENTGAIWWQPIHKIHKPFQKICCSLSGKIFLISTRWKNCFTAYNGMDW